MLSHPSQPFSSQLGSVQPAGGLRFIFYSWDEGRQQDVWLHEPRRSSIYARSQSQDSTSICLLQPDDDPTTAAKSCTTERQIFWDRTDRAIKQFHKLNEERPEVATLLIAVRADTAMSGRCHPKVHMSPALKRVLGHVDFGKMFRSLGSGQRTEEPISIVTLRDEIATLKEKLHEEQEIGLGLTLQALSYGSSYSLL